MLAERILMGLLLVRRSWVSRVVQVVLVVGFLEWVRTLIVLVSVRRALGGTDLGQLRDAVTQEFLTLNQHEQNVRSVMARVESGFLRRFEAFRHE